MKSIIIKLFLLRFIFGVTLIPLVIIVGICLPSLFGFDLILGGANPSDVFHAGYVITESDIAAMKALTKTIKDITMIGVIFGFALGLHAVYSQKQTLTNQ